MSLSPFGWLVSPCQSWPVSVASLPAMGHETCLVACSGSFVRLGPDDKTDRS